MTKITMILSLVLACNQIYAQQITYGFQGNANLAVQSALGDLYNNNEIKTGFSAGVFSNYSLINEFSLQTEVNYMQNGSKNEIVKNSYNYLSIPVMGVYTFKQQTDELWKFSLLAGPYVSFLVNAEKEYSSNEHDVIDLKDETNNTELGLTYGFSATYPIYNHNLIFNLRFGLAFTPYDKNDSDMKNKSMSIGLGYVF